MVLVFLCPSTRQCSYLRSVLYMVIVRECTNYLLAEERDRKREQLHTWQARRVFISFHKRCIQFTELRGNSGRNMGYKTILVDIRTYMAFPVGHTAYIHGRHCLLGNLVRGQKTRRTNLKNCNCASPLFSSRVWSSTDESFKGYKGAFPRGCHSLYGCTLAIFRSKERKTEEAAATI